MGTGEGATHVPENLARKQVLCEAATVDGNERLRSAPAALVDGAGDEFLAAPGFAAQEDGHVRHGHLLERFAGLLHGRTAAHYFAEGVVVFELIVQFAVFLRQFNALNRPVDEQAQMGDVDGFAEKVVSALAHGLHCGGNAAVRRQNDGEEVWKLVAYIVEQFQAVGAGHAQVENY